MKAPALALALMGLAACGGASEPEAGPPPLYKYDSMRKAVAEAREALPVFWRAFDSGDPVYSDFALNVTTPSRRYTDEPVWLVDLKLMNGDLYAGVVPEDHEIKDGLKPGDLIAFSPDQIVDWRFRKDGKFYGAYTTRAMLDLAPGARTDNIRAMFHDSPVP